MIYDMKYIKKNLRSLLFSRENWYIVDRKVLFPENGVPVYFDF